MGPRPDSFSQWRWLLLALILAGLVLLSLALLPAAAAAQPPPIEQPAVHRKCIAAAAGDAEPYHSDRHTLADCAHFWAPETAGDYAGVEIVPLYWSPERHGLPWPAVLELYRQQGVEYVLVFNECGDPQQCNLDPASAAVYYRQMLDALAGTGIKPIVGGAIHYEWFAQFAEAYRTLYGELPPAAGTHWHVHPGVAAGSQPTLAQALADIRALIGYAELYNPGGEIWISELGLLQGPCQDDACLVEFMTGVMDCLDDAGCGLAVNRVYWWSDLPKLGQSSGQWQSSLWEGPGQLTPIGALYRDWQPQPAAQPSIPFPLPTPTPLPPPPVESAPAIAIAPTGAITLTRPAYSWQPAEGAAWHWLRLQDSAGATVYQLPYPADLATCDGLVCRATPSDQLCDGDYTWWVIGYNEFWPGSGFVPWSEPLSYTVSTGRPCRPQPLAPSGAITATAAVTFSWTGLADADWYYLLVTGAAGAPVQGAWHFHSAACAGLACAQALPLAAGDYTWWLKAWNANGEGPWTEPVSFKVN